jgi:hypothetical protein
MRRKPMQKLLIGISLALSLSVIPVSIPAPCMAAGKTQVLRNKQGRILAKIKERPGGQLELRDKNNRLLGRYNVKTDTTRDKRGRLVGTGNLLPMLIPSR